MVDCPLCGCKEFGLEWSGPHLQAICKACGEVYRNRYTAIQYVQQNTPLMLLGDEPATDKQVNYIKLLAQRYTDRLPKGIAGEIISVYKEVAEE